METPAIGAGTSTLASDPTQRTKGDALNDLDLGNFIDLMIAELQNQDPLNPLDNAQILQQISQIREISATDRLNTTLDAVVLGQNISSSSSLIGKQISALTDDGQDIEGIVDRVSIAGGVAKVHVGQNAIRLTNIREILTNGTTPTQEPGIEEPAEDEAIEPVGAGAGDLLDNQEP